MINWKAALIAIGASIALPLSADAVHSDLEVNSGVLESNKMSYFAQRMGHGKRGERGQHLERLIQELDLSPEQSEQVKAIQEESKATAAEIAQQLRSQREEMKSLMASDANAEEIRTQYQTVRSLHQRMGDNRFETMLEIREVLTPEQRAEMTELIEQRQERGRGFRGYKAKFDNL